MNQNFWPFFLIVVIALGGLAYFFWSDGANGEPGGSEGHIYFSITDAAADMETVSEVRLEVEKVELYSESQGWVTATSDAKTYPLLTLRDENRAELVGSASVAADTYSRIRLSLGDVEVEEDDGSVEAAALASSRLVIDAAVSVAEGSDAHVEFDVLADKSLYTATDGSYVFAPAIAVETKRDAQVSVSGNTAVVTGGSVESSVTVGTDVDGTVKAGFELPAGVEIDVDILGSATSSADSSTGGNADGSADASASGSVDVGAGSADGAVDVNLQGGLETR